jgi:hypothetical protein
VSGLSEAELDVSSTLTLTCEASEENDAEARFFIFLLFF